jgi:hypothetical protein
MPLTPAPMSVLLKGCSMSPVKKRPKLWAITVSSLIWARERHAQARAAELEAENNNVDYELLLELQRLAACAERDLQQAIESTS